MILLYVFTGLAFILGLFGFVFGAHALIKTMAFERSTHSVEYIDAMQQIKQETNPEFETDVDKINHQLREEEEDDTSFGISEKEIKEINNHREVIL